MQMCLAPQARSVSAVKRTSYTSRPSAVAAVRTVRHAEAVPVRNLEQPHPPPLALAVVQGLCAALASFALLAGPGNAAVMETTRAGTNAGFLSNDEVLERRTSQGFLRAFDGKVALRDPANAKSFWDVKLDLKSPGTLLLRSPEGLVHVLAYESLTQIDLSDDEVVGAIANSPWEKGAKAVEAEDDDKKIQKLEMTREGFYDLISVVDP